MSIRAKIKGLVRKGTDLSAAAVLRKVFEKNFGKYGRLLDLWLDSAKKKARIELLLKGESSPLLISIERYALFEEGTETFVAVTEAAASREWMNLLIRDYLLDRKYRLPQAYSALARKIL